LVYSRNDGQIDHSIKEKRKTLFIAADLGHYIADAHMPYILQTITMDNLRIKKEFTLYGKVEFEL
jgi:hypothetical protein